MERRVAEDGVEFAVEHEALAGHDARVEPASPRRLDLRRARVDTHHGAAARHELRGERTVAAAEVEDALAGLRGEQVHDGRAEVGDEARRARVALRVPALAHAFQVIC